MTGKKTAKSEDQEYRYILTDYDGFCGEIADDTEETIEMEVRAMGYDLPSFCTSEQIFRVPAEKLVKKDIDGDHINEILTEDQQEEYGKPAYGVINEMEPECGSSSETVCDWTAHWKIEGGLKENPGVWGSNPGPGVTICEHCKHPGCCNTRRKKSQPQNPETGETMRDDMITYDTLGEDAQEIHDELYPEAETEE